jgi:predicted DNA-binding protein YlxM (UPF0122 family)
MPETIKTTKDVAGLGLSRRQILALAAHDFDKQPDHVIAKKFGVSRSAIAHRRRRARKTLARYAAALHSNGGRRVKFKPFSLLASDNI